ncbi:MAG: bifunctional phosphoribosyl-AMP cyclohydrolase/phosphoribosyl-ATP diphosphatase HisIE [Clostridia bacterium]|nr:bifunctional phosphoribosyl-AMP cyclohydrolase/phosphoribosyl-ATP diphosphatase HisIE [Clostridia bacterium]MBQ3554506.1 bifunctional phosphoribosyl-AMP cyclohydrolase/phosphoribosyl-ATP diphosphatase HisIE [Clostridia bacterium]
MDLNIKFDEKGLVPAVAQDYISGKVLMVAYMNEESLRMTIETGKATYFSRSRQELWVKGAHSGNLQIVKEILVDCDQDTLILKVDPQGPACHTGHATCFYRKIKDGALVEDERDSASLAVLKDVYDVIRGRKEHPVEGSYTNYLFEKGIDKQLKKIGEESAEVIIASKNPDVSELQYEASDLLYHLMVVMVERGLSWEDLARELDGRRK